MDIAHDTFLPFSQESEELNVEPAAKRLRSGDENDQPEMNGWRSNMYSWQSWNITKLAAKLSESGLTEEAKIFIDQEITGSMLPMLTEEHLEKYGISKLGRKLEVLKFIKDVTGNRSENVDDVQRKVFNDPIHGHISLHNLCVKIIDTPQFQRLRYIKQLGTCYLVYPGAAHNRFEHSLGVCHLAGQLVRAIQSRQPALNITDTDVLCVEIAGLCHDLGHGPFSHLFDGKFIPLVCPDTKWKHEEASRKMFHYLLDDNNLRQEFEKAGLTPQDITFIEEQITGPKKQEEEKEWCYEGRPKCKSFLYEIVANKRNAIDVDKWDYFARDCHMLGIRNNFDHSRCFHFARVLEVDGELQICSRDKEVSNLYDMFHTRNTLHRRAYQHKTTNIIDYMLVEALVKANDHIKFAGEDGKLLKMSEAVHDMKAFYQLTDNIFWIILSSTDPKLTESRTILGNILKRKLYKCIGQTHLKDKHIIAKDKKDDIKKEIISFIDPDDMECSNINADDVVIQFLYFNYGMEEKNPIDNVRFYSKNDPNRAVKVRRNQVSNLLPETFAEQKVLVHCKVIDPRSLEMVKQAFVDWCKEKGYPAPKDGEINASEFTPASKSSGAEAQSQTTPTDSTSNRTRNDISPSSVEKCKTRLPFSN